MGERAFRAAVVALRSVEFGVADLKLSRHFYEDLWALEEVGRDRGATYFRGSGGEHHIVVLRERPEPGLLRATFAAPNRSTVEALHEQIARAGGTPLHQPMAIDAPGNGYGFAFTDPEGRTFAVSSDVETHPSAPPPANRPSKLSHVVLNAADADGTAQFFRDALGFRLRDQTTRMDFLGCNADHHSVATVRLGNVSLNHVAFEVPDLDSLMRGSARVRRAGCGLEWGVGRHGPGNNIFAYFCDPSDLVIEYTTEIQQVDDAVYEAGSPSHWQPPIAGNPDYWGFATAPTERFNRASSGKSGGETATIPTRERASRLPETGL
jgi:catechol 2,3-dioxygenase-like lactoylglutathione lyase family enzyme